MLKRLLPVFLLLVFFSGMALVQFSTPDLPDNDGFYHIKLAALMRAEGLKPAFVWLPLSILNREEFYDHHFLFHVALIPFIFGDLRLGAKWAAICFATLAFLALWLVLHRQRIAFAWLWALGLLGVSEAFLYRMSITRAQSLSLAVLAIAFLWMLEGKYRHLAVLSFLYVWMYDAFPLVGMLAVLYFLAVLLVEGRFEFRPIVYVSVGILFGMLLNPYFPYNITFFIRHVVPKLSDATSVSVGNEWYPYDTGQLLENSLPAFTALALGALALGLSGLRMDVRTAFAFLVALLFGLMLFEARRFVEYFPPFALLFAAFATAPLLDDSPPAGFARTPHPNFFRAWLAPALVGLCVILAVAKSLPAAAEQVRSAKPYGLYAGASNWLMRHTQKGERVFQTDWDDFPRLFFYNTHNTYLAGLDPTYMQLYDAELYTLWVDITRGDVENPSRMIVTRFGSRFVVSDLNHGDFIEQAAADPAMEEVYRDGQAVVYEIVRTRPTRSRHFHICLSSINVIISNLLSCAPSGYNSEHRKHPAPQQGQP